MLTTVEKVLHLRACSLFRDVQSDLLSEVAAFTDESHVPGGSTLYAAGDPADTLYLVVEGRVDVVHDGVPIARLGAGEAFGAPGYARFSFALGDDDMVEGISRITSLVS